MKNLKTYRIFENYDDPDLEEVRRAFVEDVGDDFDIEEVDSIDYTDWGQKNRFFTIKYVDYSEFYGGKNITPQKIILNALMPSKYINDDSLEKSLLNFKKRLENLGYSCDIRAPFPAFSKRVTKRFTCHIQFLIERV
jgi:hypothetical protein